MLTLQVKLSDMQENKSIHTYREILKERILTAAMTDFAARGVRAVKMDDIATALSISKRTLYEVYENKEDLLFEGIKKYNQIKQDEMRRFASGNVSVMDIILHSFRLTIEGFKNTSPAFYSDLLRYPKIMKYFEEDKEKTQGQFLDLLRRGIAEGYFRADVNYELVVCVFDAQHRYVMMSQMYKMYSMEPTRALRCSMSFSIIASHESVFPYIYPCRACRGNSPCAPLDAYVDVRRGGTAARQCA